MITKGEEEDEEEGEVDEEVVKHTPGTPFRKKEVLMAQCKHAGIPVKLKSTIIL